jgi:hypothetical protein
MVHAWPVTAGMTLAMPEKVELNPCDICTSDLIELRRLLDLADKEILKSDRLWK